MFKEIGGNFWLEPKQLQDPGYTDLDIQFIREDEEVVYTSSGRGAISLILDQISHTNGVALLPLYTCESVILPFLKKGYDLHYYDINIDLSVNEEKFLASVERYEPGIVFLHPYFGFDTLMNFRPKYQWLHDLGVIVIEDITHSLFGRFEKKGVEYYLASLRKWVALPDGGVAISSAIPMRWDEHDIHEKLVNQNIKAIRMKYEYTKSLDKRLKPEFRKLFYSSEELLDKDCSIYDMSDISKAILAKTDFKFLGDARRRNYAYLLSELSGYSYVKPVFEILPEDVVPLYFPVYVMGNREKLQKYFADDEIYMPIIWPTPHPCKDHLTDNTRYIYNNILCIPCDQRYKQYDMKRIVKRFSSLGEKA